MPEYTLVLLEVTGIQDYVFNSNHLVQNIGASELVEVVTEEWLVNALEDEFLRINVTWDKTDGLRCTPGESLPDSNLDAEVVYRGGGVAMILFNNKERAKNFLKRLTRRVIEEAPGLQLVTIHDHVDWEKESLAYKHKKLRQRLSARKLDRPFSAPLAGLGVTAQCVFTGMPTVGWDDDPRLVGTDAAVCKKDLGEPLKRISAEVAQKIKKESRAQKRLVDLVPRVQEEGFKYAKSFNDFGEKGTSSYIAVIHADGNEMGKRFMEIVKSYDSPEKNSEYVKVLRAFSRSIQDNACNALIKTIDYLLDHWEEYEKETGNSLISRRNKKLLPFRPIVFGGDDVTFVCEGRLGLTLAEKYLEFYSKNKLSDGKLAYARAGVAVVKSHYPFSRAYALADSLAGEAKKRIKNLIELDEDTISVMDWHFSTTGIEARLEEIRCREYTSVTGISLLMRPIRISDAKNKWRTWKTFSTLVSEFKHGKNWSGRRNKVKSLRDTLRQGKEGVELFLKNYGLDKLPEISKQQDMALSGWQGDDCGYFDAIEALDFMIIFDNNKKDEKS